MDDTREKLTGRDLDSEEPNPSSDDRSPGISWWATEFEMVTANPGLRVRSRVQSSRLLGSTFVLWVGQRPVVWGWRPNKKFAWRAINHHLDVLMVGAEQPSERPS